MDDASIPPLPGPPTPETWPPESAFAAGCSLLSKPDGDGYRYVDQIFEFAASKSGPDMLWRIAQAYIEAFDARAAAWMRRAVAGESDPDGIIVDPGTLAIRLSHGSPSYQDWEVCVEADDRRAVLAALDATEPRVMFVSDGGREFLTDEEMIAAPGYGAAMYTPNYAIVDADGPTPRILMDCKDGIMPLMARTVLRIVREELRAVGIEKARLFTRERGERTTD